MNIQTSAAQKLLGFSIFLLTFFLQNSAAQVTFTAKDGVNPYNGQFRVGYNIGYSAGWTDKTLADLAAGNDAFGVTGTGAKATRQGLFFSLFDTWGYTIRVAEMQHYETLGMDEQTGLILGGDGGGAFPYPPQSVRDQNFYCPNHQSEVFANLYEPIWDNNNGTPINENNYYAAYLYNTVNTYKDYVRFWEIWNEPGFDYTGNKGWRPPGDPAGNWWDEDPDPCDYRLRAPIQSYVRMLRISWDVIKTLDPDAYVVCGAPGFPSFIDAILRNTDNPNQGAVTTAFPHKGGAYFDAVAYHSYPHFDGSVVLDPFNQVYMRTSDQAAKGVVDYRDRLQAVLDDRGFNGLDFPKKHFIVTEGNLPRKIFSNDPSYFGNINAQRNFLMKAAIECKKNNIFQYHVYTLSENTTEANAVYEFNLMGLYKKIDNQSYNTVEKLPSGIGLLTTSKMLFNTWHNQQFSNLLSTNPNVRAEVFEKYGGAGQIIALWAKQQNDNSEQQTANYQLPVFLDFGTVHQYNWNSGETGNSQIINPIEPIALTATPVFLDVNITTSANELPRGIESISLSPNPSEGTSQLQFNVAISQNIRVFVTNSLGQIHQEMYVGFLASGVHQFDLNLTSGLYFVSIQSESGITTRRLFVE